MGMGFELVVMVLAGAYFGKYIDDYMKWQGLATAGLIVGSLVLWFYHLMVLLKKIQADDEQP